MTDFVAKIDQYTQEFLDRDYPNLESKLWGFTELVTQQGQVMPVTINGTGERLQVSLDDQYDFITWVRLNRINLDVDTDDTWGLKANRRQRAVLRWVVAHDVALGENLVTELASELPTILHNIPGYQFVFIDEDVTIDADHEAIYTTELGPTAYEQHRFDWNIYAIELTVEYLRCDGADIRLTESGEFRILE